MQGIRKDALTFTRFLAAISIVVFHFGTNVFPFSLEPLRTLFENAYVGVSYFFVLSGYIMILAYGQREKLNALEYYRSRFARIYPVYFLALVLAFVLQFGKMDYLGSLLNLSLLQAWIPSKALSINGPGWSLSTELLFYLLFPFLFWSYKRIPKYVLITVVVVFFLATQIILNMALNSDFYQGFPSASHDLLHYFPLMHLNEFLVGNIAGLIYLQYFGEKKRNNALAFGIVIVLVIILEFFPVGLSKHGGLMLVVFIPIILLISTDDSALTKVLSHRVLVFLGEISYGIYILQAPIFSIFRRASAVLGSHFNITINDSVLFTCYLVGLILTAGVAYIFLERPLRNAINSIRITSR